MVNILKNYALLALIAVYSIQLKAQTKPKATTAAKTNASTSKATSSSATKKTAATTKPKTTATTPKPKVSITKEAPAKTTKPATNSTPSTKEAKVEQPVNETKAPVQNGEVDGPKSYANEQKAKKENKPSISKKPARHIRKQSYIGLRGGVNFSTFANNTVENTATDPVSYPLYMTYTGGLQLDLALSSRMGLQIDFNYSQQGYKGEIKDLAIGEVVREETAHVPVFLNAKFGNKVKIVLGVGGYGSYRLKREVGLYTIGQKPENLIEEDYITKETQTDEFIDNRIDYGAAGLVGIQIPIKRAAFRLEARYLHGLEGASSNTVTNQKYGNLRLYSGTASMLFPLGKGK
jgi:hypothetical protein